MQLKRSCNDMLLKNLLKKYHQRNKPNSPLNVWLTFAMPSSCKDCIFIYTPRMFEARMYVGKYYSIWANEWMNDNFI